MDGVFMRKTRKIVCCVLLLMLAGATAALIGQRTALRSNMIRMHVVANSDSQEDQRIKLQVKDAVVAYLQKNMKVKTVDEAKEYILENTDEIKVVADAALQSCGSKDRAQVSLQEEAFDTRVYDTFKLPAGVYTALRIRIGEAKGENWWCVAFPALCIPASAEEVREVAVSAGFDPVTTQTITQAEKYEIRFFLLDCLGKIENFLFNS